MELFLDTADAQLVAELSQVITISGVTTNPSIITRSQKSPEQVISELLAVLEPEQKLFVQLIADDFEGMMEDARDIVSLSPQICIKIAVSAPGLRAIKAAKQAGMTVLATAIYSANQAFLAALNGADYLAPYVNRMCNYGDGIQQVADLQKMLSAHQLESKICAASFKNAQQVHELLCQAVAALTLPPDLLKTMIEHPLTKQALNEFGKAWQESYGRTQFGG